MRATLSTIRTTEGHGNTLDYNAQYGNNTFESFEDHPREQITRWGYTATAAGAYQFVEGTWDGLVSQLGLTDFSPGNQDAAAVSLIESVSDASEQIQSGDYESALNTLSGQWSSLPGGQHQWQSNVNQIFLNFRAQELKSQSIIATPQGSLNN